MSKNTRTWICTKCGFICTYKIDGCPGSQVRRSCEPIRCPLDAGTGLPETPRWVLKSTRKKRNGEGKD